MSQARLETLSVKQQVEYLIKNNKYLIFGYQDCPYCIRAQSLLKHKKVLFVTIERDDEYKQYLQERQKQSTVPYVYINHEFIGGCTQLERLPHPI